jgi:hypothetical protein
MLSQLDILAHDGEGNFAAQAIQHKSEVVVFARCVAYRQVDP